jgi:Flp pilus assembly protein TadD
MLDTEAFREFKQGLTLLRDNYTTKALPHMQRAMDLDRNNPYYMSYLGVVLARSEKKWGEAERLCDAAVRMKRNQAQLYLNLAEVYATAGRKDEAVDALTAGLKYARRDVRLSIALNRLTDRREPVLSFLERQHPVNRRLGLLRHRALQMFGRA